MDRFDDSDTYLKDTVKVTAASVIFFIIMKVLELNRRSDSIISKSLVDQAHRWYTISTQDKSPLYAYQHINFATAYLNAARHSANDTTLEQVSGIDVHGLYKRIDDFQRQTLKTLSTKQIGTKGTKGKTNVHLKSSWLN